MFKVTTALVLGCGMLLGSMAAANAGVYSITATTALTGGNGFNAGPGALPATPTNGTTATATFTYTGNLNFNLQNAPDTNSAFGFSATNISNYSGSGTVVFNSTPVANFANITSFLNSTASTSGYPYGSLYTIDLGSLAAGTVLTIAHDDGVSVYQSGTKIGNTVTGPTERVTDTVTLGATGATTLYYTRQNNTPSVLSVSVPEPASMALLGAGLVGTWFARRRKA